MTCGSREAECAELLADGEETEICTQSSPDSQQPAGRGTAGPSRAQPILAGASRTHCASSDGTSLFAVAPASYDTYFKKRRTIRLGPGEEEKRLSALHWKLMYAADAYGLQISRQDWNDAPLAKRATRSQSIVPDHQDQPTKYQHRGSVDRRTDGQIDGEDDITIAGGSQGLPFMLADQWQ